MTFFEASGLTKHFGGVEALNDVDLTIEEEEMVGLVGPNGAGKTTFFNCVTGFLEPTGGTVLFRDEDVTGVKPYETARKGMVRTFQHSRPFSSMTVKENVMLPALDHPGENTLPAILQTNDMREFEARVSELADETLERFGLIEKADDYASELSGGERKLLEISRAMMLEPDLFLLDEPYAGVEEAMISDVANVLRDLNEDGITLIVIEHRLEALIDLVDRMVVLHEGELLADGEAEAVVQDDEVIDVYLASSVE